MEPGEYEKRERIKLADIYVDEQSAPNYCIREKLVMVNANRKNLGNVNLNINVSQLCNCFEFVVHTSGKFYSNKESDEISSHTMTSRVNLSLITSEETRHENSHSPIKLNDRTLFIARIPKKYYVSTKHNNGVYLRENSRNILNKNLNNFVSEGANILILKYLAINQLSGKLKTRSMVINGDICKSALIAAQEDLTLHGIKYETTKVTRLIKIATNSNILKLETWLNAYGQIIQHKWSNSEFFMQIDNRIGLEDKLYNLPLEEDWVNDEQLTSVFLDEVGKLRSKFVTYISDYPEMRRLLADFIIRILLTKPDDVIDYAVDFFISTSM